MWISLVSVELDSVPYLCLIECSLALLDIDMSVTLHTNVGPLKLELETALTPRTCKVRTN